MWTPIILGITIIYSFCIDNAISTRPAVDDLTSWDVTQEASEKTQHLGHWKEMLEVDDVSK